MFSCGLNLCFSFFNMTDLQVLFSNRRVCCCQAFAFQDQHLFKMLCSSVFFFFIRNKEEQWRPFVKWAFLCKERRSEEGFIWHLHLYSLIFCILTGCAASQIFLFPLVSQGCFLYSSSLSNSSVYFHPAPLDLFISLLLFIRPDKTLIFLHFLFCLLPHIYFLLSSVNFVRDHTPPSVLTHLQWVLKLASSATSYDTHCNGTCTLSLKKTLICWNSETGSAEQIFIFCLPALVLQLEMHKHLIFTFHPQVPQVRTSALQ